MVLEQLYPIEFLKEKPRYALLLSFAFTVFATFFGMMIFPQDPALVIVAMASTLLIPSLYQFTVFEEKVEREIAGMGVKDVLITNKQLFKVYTYMFFGSFFAFAIFSIVLPSLATNYLFRTQMAAVAGGAIAGIGTKFSMVLLWELLSNNFQVLMLCFIVSIIAGNGSIYLIIWNASVWGTVFGTLAKTTALHLGASSGVLFLLIMISVFPHVLLEMGSYILAVISGTVISNALAREHILSKRFGKVLLVNLVILGLALLVLLIGGIVETYVLDNFMTYQRIIQLSFGG